MINLKFEFNTIYAPNLLGVWQIHFEFEHFNANVTYISHFHEELPDIIANKLQINSDKSEIWFSAIYTPNLLSVWQIHFEFEHFNANVTYISHFHEELPDIIANKLQINSDKSEIWFSAIYTPNLLSVWQIHFEFEHFNANVPIAVISMKNYQISLQLNFKLSWSISIWIQCNICTKFTRRLKNTLRIWTFHCSCHYISHFHLELPNNIATKLQMNSDQSEIWFSAIFTPNLLSVWQIHFEFEHFNANVPIAVISI